MFNPTKSKPNLRFGFLTPNCPLVKLYKNRTFFCKNPFFFTKKLTVKEFPKTNVGFGFPTPDYLWSNFMENKFFLKKPYFFAKKINLKKSQKTNDGFGFPDHNYL